MNILFYGSCNVTSLIKTPNLKQSILGRAFEDHNVSCVVCHETELLEEQFLQLIENQDVIVTVPINKEYRNKTYLSTEYILRNKKKDAKVMIFVSLHSHYYYFDYGHIFDEGIHIKQPHHLHFRSLFNFYKQGKTEKQFIEECVLNKDFKSYQQLEDLANKDTAELFGRQNSLIELQARHENIIIIDAAKFIKDNYKKYQMFYSLNHPSNYLLYFIAEEILKELNLPIDLVNRAAKAFDDKFLLYECQQKYFDFNIHERAVDYTALCNNYNITTLEQATCYFYNSYKGQGIKKY
jgi:hypothetical protein